MTATHLDDRLTGLIANAAAADPIADPAVEVRARQLVLDTLGCAISGLATDEAGNLARHLACCEPGALKIPGMDRGLSVSAYLIVFAAAACAFEFQEGLGSARGRPGLHAVPAVLAHATERGENLRSTLDAVVIGYEVGGRIGQAYRIAPGMHVDGTWGTFAAAAGIGRLLGLSVDAIRGAIGIAACQVPFSLYHPVPNGSLARNLYAGHGAVLGHFAVMAAMAGISGPAGSLAEHMRRLLGSAPKALATAGAGGSWLVEEGYLKRYPAVKHVHYGAEAARRWLKGGGRLGRGDRIELSIYREAIVYCGNRMPRSPIEAQFSLTWGLAWVLRKGDLTVEAFTAEALAEPEMRSLEERIELVEDAALTIANRRGARLAIGAKGAPPQVVAVDGVPGDPDQPLSRDEIAAKFLDCTVPVIGEQRARRILSTLLDGPLEGPLDLG